jgi:ABC-type branched-subunit amino acid transport system substrate-binding protein
MKEAVMSRRHLPAKYRSLVLAVAAATALAACSSTNAQKDDDDAAALAVDSSAAPFEEGEIPIGEDGEPLTSEEIVEAVEKGELPASALAAASSAPRTQSGGGSAAAAPGSAKPAPPSGTSTGSTGGGVPSAGKSGPGFSAGEVKIGISLFKIGSIGEQFGIDAEFGDGQKQAQAVVDYVNAKGGIAGRKVKPVYYTVDFGRTDGFQDGGFEAEACEKWTNDDRVFAAINNAMARAQLLPCLAKKGVPGIHDGMPIDEKRLSPYRDFYYTGAGPKALTIDRTATVTTKALGARGFYKNESAAKPTVVGIVHFDDEFYREVVNKKMIPAIKSFGVQKVVVQAAPYGATTSDSTYVSRFQAEGVTHVHFLGEANAYPMTFMPAAENQRYRPKYGISTEQYPNLLESTQPIPREQLANTTGIGWSQLLDVNNPADPGPTGPNDTLCLDIQKKAGQNMSERGARFTATTYCHGLFFLKKNLDTASALTPAGLAQAVAGLGNGYSSPGTFNPVSYSAMKHDGGTSYREFEFRNGAFVYTSGIKRMPS